MGVMSQWTLGDDPMLHPLWELQVSLEQGMLRNAVGIGIEAIYQPTIIPPRRWSPTRHGGYYTPFVPNPEPLYSGWRNRPKAAFAALNALQETPWRIDPEALAAAELSAKRQPPNAAAEMTLSIARRYQRWPFYFPYCFDGEGRIYPIPVHLQPERSELARSLLVSL
jgi:DNA-directed RNA polymerase